MRVIVITLLWSSLLHYVNNFFRVCQVIVITLQSSGKVTDITLLTRDELLWIIKSPENTEGSN